MNSRDTMQTITCMILSEQALQTAHNVCRTREQENVSLYAVKMSLYHLNDTKGRHRMNYRFCQAFSQLVPISDSPGVEATNSLVSHNAQVGLVVFPVPPDVPQHAAWHSDNSPPTSLHWAWEHAAGSGLLLILGCLLCQAVLREDAVSEET